jgi:hypothetical protein
MPQHLAERLHGNALEMSDRCRSGSIIRQRSPPSACRLGGMQTVERHGGTRTNQQPKIGLPSR